MTKAVHPGERSVGKGALALASLQATFQAYLMDGRPELVSVAVSDGARAPKATMLGVYHHAYWARLIEVLRNDFPKLHQMLGDQAFDALARACISRHPSTYRSVRWLGLALPRFLESEPAYIGTPALSQMAAFEWAQAMAFDAADESVAEPQELLAIPAEAWGSLRLKLHPSVNRVVLAKGVVEAWAALNRGESAMSPEPEPLGPWLVWRQGLGVRYRPLPAEEDVALGCAAGDQNFARVCEAVAVLVGEDRAALRSAELLNGWLASGLIVDLDADAFGSI